MITVLLALAAVGGVVLFTRDDGSDLDLAAIAACRTPEVHQLEPVREADVAVDLDVETVGSVEVPTALDNWPGGGLVVAEREGRVLVVANDDSQRELLDISGRIELNAEGGILGIAVDPMEEHLYVHHTDLEGTSRLLSFPIAGDALDLDAEREILAQEHPGLVHNGGDIAFGPDGLLYVGFGDGSQNVKVALESEGLDTWAGKILRIEPTPTATDPYRVPEDNPFAGGDDTEAAIWAQGFRNPWRFDFDPVSGDLWVGDVGNDCREEINVIPEGRGGLDFGWPRYEGTHGLAADEDDGSSTWPVLTVDHGPACAVIGGMVYRGTALADLDGAFLYSDLCDGTIRWVRRDGDGVIGGSLDLSQEFVLSIRGGEDHLYLLTAEDGLLRVDLGAARTD